MFLVIDETWQLFSQTGNIEAYLLLKELENGSQTNYNPRNSEKSAVKTEM